MESVVSGSQKKTALVILNYKTWQDTLSEITNIQSTLGVSPRDVIVVDNGSPNESFERLNAANLSQYKFTLLKSEKNGGYASGNNIGLRYAWSHGYEYALVLNNDVIISDQTILIKMENVLEANKRVAVVNPDILAPDGRLFNRDSRRPSIWDFTLGMFAYRKKGRRISDVGGFGYVYRPQGCCMLVRLRALEEVGWLDEKTFLYYEEFIIAERLLKSGYKCACCTGASVIHNHSNTVSTSMQKKQLLNTQMESYDYYLYTYRMYSHAAVAICNFFFRIKFHLLERSTNR